MVLKDCEQCLVYGTDNRPLAKARAEVMDDDRVLLYFKYTKLRSIRVRAFVDFYDRTLGVVRCYCDLIIQNNTQANRLTEPWMAKCTIIKVQDTFQNISAGGIFLLTSHALKKNELFSFHPRLGEGMVSLEAKVVRIGALVKGEYSYGCQFVGISLDSEASVRKFVYMKQKERQNRLGKRA